MTRPPPGSGLAARLRAVDVPMLAKVAFVALCLACAIGIVVYPTYPNYDSYYALCGARRRCTARCRTSRASACRPSTRWRSPPAGC